MTGKQKAPANDSRGKKAAATDGKPADRFSLVDDAGRGFAAEAAAIVAEYRETVRALAERRDSEKAAAELSKLEAEERFKSAYSAERRACEDKVRESAARWYAKATRPEILAKAAETYTKPFDNGLAEPSSDPETILKAIQWQEQARIDAEESRKRSKIINRYM